MCDLSWFNALLESMGLFGLFLGALTASIYADRFGRKNAILVWSAISMGCLVIHAFMPDKYSFMVLRVLGNGANVRIDLEIMNSTISGNMLLEISIWKYLAPYFPNCPFFHISICSKFSNFGFKHFLSNDISCSYFLGR